jgi:hypothetical protein
VYSGPGCVAMFNVMRVRWLWVEDVSIRLKAGLKRDVLMLLTPAARLVRRSGPKHGAIRGRNRQDRTLLSPHSQFFELLWREHRLPNNAA